MKVLFATETFALGINMPARTVVFTSLQKVPRIDTIARRQTYPARLSALMPACLPACLSIILSAYVSACSSMARVTG